MSYEYVYFPLKQEKGPDLSGVTATAGDVDEGKIFVNSSGQEVEGTSTYKADYTALHTLIGQTTAVAEDVAQGKVFVNASGVQTTGTATPGGSDEEFKKMIERPNPTYELTLPNGITKIADYCFERFSTLRKVNLPNTLTYIGTYAFENCSTMGSITLPSSLLTIKQYAFSGCAGLIGTITLPQNVTTIERQIFNGCGLINEIIFLGTPTTLNTQAFYSAPNIRTIRVPWQEGTIAGAPWGASSASIEYGYTP